MVMCWYILFTSIVLMLLISIVVKNYETAQNCCIPVFILGGGGISLIIIIKMLQPAVDNWYLFIINAVAIVFLFVHVALKIDDVLQYLADYRNNFTAEHTKTLITFEYLKTVHITNPQKWNIKKDKIQYGYMPIGFKNFWEYVKFTIWYKQYKKDKRIEENRKVELSIYESWVDDVSKFKEKVEKERAEAERQALDAIEKTLASPKGDEKWASPKGGLK